MISTMQLPEPYVFIPVDMLHNYIIKYINSDKKLTTQDIEVAAGYWTCKVLNNAHKAKYQVGFPLPEPIEKIMPDFNGKDLNDVKIILQKYVLKHTVEDFAIRKSSVPKYEKVKRWYGWPFQVKRVGYDIVSNYSDNLATKINKVCSVYKAGVTGLLIIPEIGPNLEKKEEKKVAVGESVKDVVSKLSVKEGSFKLIWLLNINNTENKVWITQIYPKVMEIGRINRIV